MAIQIGQTLGNYKLIRLLGSGGFGDVYLGENITIGTQVAIKVLYGHFSPQAIQDFKNEARTIWSLKHPHIVPLLDFGEQAGVFYMIMEYAAHGTLEDRHPQGTPVPLGTVVSYVKQIAEALQYAHNNKIVHRDIKPANIFVGQSNEILVGDFGIAVAAHRTQTMQLQVPLGTPGYAAPEQAQGLARPASDQYALGIMVCEWLGGLSSPFPANVKIPGVTLAVEQVVLKAFEKDYKQRFPDVQAFADALERASNPPLPQAAAVPQNAVAPVQPIVPPIPQLQGPALVQRLYQEGIRAEAAGDVELAASLWAQGNNVYPRAYDYHFGDLLWGLIPQRIANRQKQARKARSSGDWQQEIAVWNEIIQLKNNYFYEGSIKRNKYNDDERNSYERYTRGEKGKIETATQNLQSAWLYNHAQQLINNGNRRAAKKVLTTLWKNAPSYGDPLGLAKKAGMLTPTSLTWFWCLMFLFGTGLSIAAISFRASLPPILFPLDIIVCTFCSFFFAISFITIITRK